MGITANIVWLWALCGVIAQTFADPLCDGCVFENGSAFNNHTDCKKYVQCEPNQYGDLVGKVRNCSFSTYWNFEVLTCSPAETTFCKNDFCADKAPLYEYKSETNCRGYWVCTEQGKSRPLCCPQNFLYDVKSGCVEDVEGVCEDNCFDDYAPGKPKKCVRFPIVGEPAKFRQKVKGFATFYRDCPPGTLFNADDCECTEIIPPKIEDIKCIPEVHLTFDKSHTDQSLFAVGVTNQHVEVKDGVAKFNGINSRLIIPRFNNVEQSSTIVIRAKYSSPHQEFSGMARALVVNGDCDRRPTIMISEDDQNVYFGVGTNSKSFAFTHVPQLPVDAAGEKYVEYKFKNGVLFGSNGVDQNFTAAPGVLRGVNCALQIGYADNMKFFKGTIDEVTIYLCDPDE